MSFHKTFALCYSGNPWNDSILNQGYYNNKLYIRELKENVFNDLFNRGGFLYEINSDSIEFSQVDSNLGKNNREFWSFNSVKYFKVTYYNNILKELKNSYDIDLISYEEGLKWTSILTRKSMNSLKNITLI